MTLNINLFRALSRYYIAQVARIATYIVVSIAFLLIIGTWALAHFFSPWWWLLAIPIFACVIAFFILRFFTMVVARFIYPDKVTRAQAADIKAFISKINHLLELKHINPVMIGLTSLRDFIFYRELRTLKSFIEDSTTLSSDFKKLYDQFK